MVVVPSEYLERHHEPDTPMQSEASWVENVFTDSEMDDIVALNDSLFMEPGPIGSVEVNNGQYKGLVDPIIRHCSIGFMFPNDDTKWIFERVTAAAIHANKGFDFDLQGLADGIQLTRYDKEGQHYGWHQDRGPGRPNRKLSVTVQLSDPADYEGGELQLSWGTDPVVADKRRGVATFFPSFTNHRVTPVTQGTRYSLVAWFVGPLFK